MSGCHAFIQARMSSSRFPGKVLEPLAGLPSIVYLARRAEKALLIDGLAVATSTDPSDDPLAGALLAHGVPFFRGDLHDVLGRFGAAAAATNADEVVRLTGDCPLIDPGIVDSVIQLRRDTGADYASNVDPPTFPDGLDCEVFTRNALDLALASARLPSEREHVTLWMRSEAAALRRNNLSGLIDASALRLTVDYPDDLQVVRELVDSMPAAQSFDYYDLLRALAARRHLLDSNRHRRNEALLAADSTHMIPR